MSSDDPISEQGADNDLPGSEIGDTIQVEDTSVLASLITDSDFDDWYSRYQFAENIRNGTPYFNGPPKSKPPGKFSASDLLKCHRKIHYKHRNAPQETGDPDGIFYFGTQFEEDLAERFLRDSVSVPGTFLRNSVWMDSTFDTEVGTISLVGSTDPTIVDETGRPILLSEIKTTSSVEKMTQPREHHRAQAHAYLHGLSKKYDRKIRDVIFLYADRETLEVKTFHETFDKRFWRDRVIDWLQINTYYRVFGFLPPAEPERDWECEYCPYKNRCGQTSAPYEDLDAAGFLPLMEYPHEKVIEYLEAHPEAKLTPSLAHLYPDLADQYDVFDWHCGECEQNFAWDEITWDGNDSPKCPICDSKGNGGGLRGPAPEEQHHIEVIDQQGEKS